MQSGFKVNPNIISNYHSVFPKVKQTTNEIKTMLINKKRKNNNNKSPGQPVSSLSACHHYHAHWQAAPKKGKNTGTHSTPHARYCCAAVLGDLYCWSIYGRKV
jgi:hypothetical protein